MSQTTAMTVRVSGALSEFVASERLKAELTRTFAAAEDIYRPLSAAEVIARNRS